MALRELEYQGRVLARLDDYLTELAGWKTKADKIEAANAGETDPDLIRPVPDFALKTWEALRTGGKLPEARADIPYSPRQDGAGRSVPNVVFKVPTGGGARPFWRWRRSRRFSAAIWAGKLGLCCGSCPMRPSIHRPRSN